MQELPDDSLLLLSSVPTGVDRYIKASSFFSQLMYAARS
jgi:hypothetical protein